MCLFASRLAQLVSLHLNRNPFPRTSLGCALAELFTASTYATVLRLPLLRHLFVATSSMFCSS